MMSVPLLSLKGCTRAEALARLTAWLDDHDAEMTRTVASRWSADDGEACPATFQSDLAQLRAACRRSRAEALARAADVFDQLFGPERTPDDS